MEKIKPCPFCGGRAQLNSRYGFRARTFFVFCKCEICGGTGKSYSSDDAPSEHDWKTAECSAAINAWNMRTSEAIDD